jgi:acyl dehydratase
VSTATGIRTTITDERLAELKSKVGVPKTRTYEDWELDDAKVLRSQIRSWAVLLGDMRPLFVDADYAAASPWKTLIAPPSVLTCYEQIDPEVESLPGSQSILERAIVEWERPIRLNDILVPSSEIESVDDVTQGAVEGRVVAMTVATEVQNQDRAVVGRMRLAYRCVERGTAAQRALFGERSDAHMHTKADIDALREEYKQERQRGAEALYIEDVKAGMELEHVLKGPTTRPKYLGRMVGNWYWGHLQGWEKYDSIPELFFKNENNSPEPIAATDWGHHRAQRWGGLPGALDSNSERIHYFSHLLLNWMGDHGHPSRMNLQFPIQNMVGDVTRSYGRVTGTRVDGERGIATLDLWQENQLGERVTTGTAEVFLPTRSGGPAIRL